MSLSVLIPVYNRDVTLLVSSLARLLTKEKLVSEIILLDDASEPGLDQLNQQLVDSDFIFYHNNPFNLGRVKTRRLLAEKARYNHLLFLDCDVRISAPDFITRYAGQIKTGTGVCCGGIVYDATEPDNNKYKLHWRYGTFRESQPGVFLPSNLLIKKDLFLDLNFDNGLSQYGHEDTLWKIELLRKGIRINYIANPVMHEGVESADVFVSKSLLALENLMVLEKLVSEKELIENVKLYQVFKKLKGYSVIGIIAWAEKWFHPSIIKNLSSYNPSLKYFDWMRLAHFIRLKQNAGKN